MAQSTEPVEDFTIARNVAVAVPATGNTEILNVPVAGRASLGICIKNVHATVAFDAFLIQYQYHPAGDFVTVASAAADWTTPNWPVLGKTATPVTLAAAGEVGMVLDVRGVYAVKVLASGNAAESTATIDATASNR